MSVLVFTGKGGVGKTTCAAATAIHLAARGKRVLVVSSDAAHSLGDCLQVRLSGTPREIVPSLFAMEVDALQEMKEKFGEVRNTMLQNMEAAGLDTLLAAEMIEFPGSEELFALLRVAEIRDRRSFDAVILDCAPTGNTLRFLNFSEFLSPIQRALRLERTYSRLTAPLTRLVGGTPTQDSYYQTIFNTFGAIQRARQSFLEEDTRFRIVLNPERLAIVESQRAVSFLNVAGFFVDTIITNRVLSQEVNDPFFEQWKQLHRQYTAEIHGVFHPTRVLEVPLRRKEVGGIAELEEFAQELYGGEEDVSKPLSTERPFLLERVGSRFHLRIRLPQLDRAELALEDLGDCLLVRIGPYQRRIQIPSMLSGSKVAAARYDERFLTIEFEVT